MGQKTRTFSMMSAHLFYLLMISTVIQFSCQNDLGVCKHWHPPGLPVRGFLKSIGLMGSGVVCLCELLCNRSEHIEERMGIDLHSSSPERVLRCLYYHCKMSQKFFSST